MKIVHLLFGLVLLFSGALAHADKININAADAKTIAQNLNGVGMKRAQAIVKYRDENGNFKTAEDLVKVKGIGIKTVEANRENILLVNPEQKITPAN